MIPRGRLDIGWGDLLAAGMHCLRPGRREEMQQEVEALSVGTEGLISLSVRSGFDLLLTVMDYPAGSEILVSAVTIRNMVHIIEEHGLVPVPVDVDMDDLTVDLASLEAAISPRSKAILVAHLFGSRMDLSPVARVARERGLLLIEDCAQSFTGDGYWGHAESDVALTSFGPIKSATALGGAVVLVRDSELRGTMRAVQGDYPVQGRWWFAKRVARFALVRALMYPLPFSFLTGLCQLTGKNHDDVVSQSIRGFSGAGFFSKIRHQPGYPLLALLARRIRTYGPERIARRTAVAESADALMSGVRRPGRSAASHSHWVYPVLARDPDALAEHLWSRGFDGTRGKWSLYVVQAPEHLVDRQATRANEVMSQVVYLPVYPAVAPRQVERLARVVDAFSREPGERAPSWKGVTDARP